MLAADCVEWREQKPNTSRPDDILKCIKPLITPHYFRHNYVTMLYEAGVDPLIAMKIVGHTGYQTTANIYNVCPSRNSVHQSVHFHCGLYTGI